MKKRNQKPLYRQPASQMSERPIAWGYLVLTIFCAALIAGGFFFAGLQHFQTIDLGIKNAQLRNEEEELRSEKRRLILVREIAISPGELARTAKRLGFEEIGETLQTLNVVATPDLKPQAEATVINVKSTNTRDARKDENRKEQAVLKTASVQAVIPAKNSVAKTAETTLATKTVGEVKGESRPRRIVEIKADQSSTASSLSRLK
ncbi:hypothetical protein BH24ACI3_BH24ACI3_04220 [soil metagenome]